MKRIQATNIDSIKNDYPEITMILLGEIHGIKQNVEVLEQLLQSYLKDESVHVVLTFEWVLANDDINILNDYIHNKSNQFPLNTFFLDSDGRFTKDHILFLNNIRKSTVSNRVSIDCFDSDSFTQDRNKKMSETLLEIQKANPKAILIAETGVMHARTKEYIDEEAVVQIPMGAYLAKTQPILSIFLRYLDGHVEVEGTRYPVTDASSQLEGPEQFFDLELMIQKADSSTLFSNLTEIQVLLS